MPIAAAVVGDLRMRAVLAAHDMAADAGQRDLSTGTRAGVRKPPRNETAGSRAPGGSASAMGNWLAPLSAHGPEDVAPARRSQNWSWDGFGAQLDYRAIVLTWNLCGPILPSPVVA